MPLSRVMGYYCLLLLLSSVIFARWLPVPMSTPDTAADMALADTSASKPAPLLVSLRPAVGVTWPDVR